MKRWLTEALFPWLRLQRIERELDAEERFAVAKMKHELWRKQADAALSEFRNPMLFKSFL